MSSKLAMPLIGAMEDSHIHGFSANVENLVMLSAFEMELDALLDGLDQVQVTGVSEPLLRRILSMQELVASLLESTRRIELKMALVGDAMAGASNGH